MTTAGELLDCSKFDRGSVIDVRTKSRHYQLECLGGDVIRISGHPDFCPTPVLAQLRGSLSHEGKLKQGLIVRGMRLVFECFDGPGPVTTSEIIGVDTESTMHDRMAA